MATQITNKMHMFHVDLVPSLASDNKEDDDACSDATELERRMRASGRGSMNWGTHRVHVFHLPIHTPGPECFLQPQDLDNYKRKKPCCCCCNKCHRRGKNNSRQVQARWDNRNACFVPVYRDRNYSFVDPPMYYRYLGLDMSDSPTSWIMIVVVFVLLISLLSADGYSRNWEYQGDIISSSSPAMAAWILLISCTGLLFITLCAFCVCSMFMPNIQSNSINS